MNSNLIKIITGSLIECLDAVHPLFDKTGAIFMSTMDFSILEQFCELLGDDGKAEANELVNLYLTDSIKQLDSMSDSLKGEDITTFQRAAHSFKSSCANVGAVELSQIAQKMETQASVEAIPVLQEYLNTTQQQFVEVTKNLKHWMTT